VRWPSRRVRWPSRRRRPAKTLSERSVRRRPAGAGELDRHEPGVGATSAADPDLVAGGGAFEVVAEVVAELVAADVD
jgi:hypothetical protein